MKVSNAIGFIVCSLVLIACEPVATPLDNPETNDTIVSSDTITIINDTVIIGTGGKYIGHVCDIGPAKHMIIVKFYNLRQENKVIVQHPFKRQNYEYYEDIGLFLNISPKQDDNNGGLDMELVYWIEQKMHLTGTSPYIPLTNGYYLIDWKWYQLMPFCAIEATLPGAAYDYYANHILNHCFMTDINWCDLKDLAAGYPNSLYTQPVRGIEIVRADYITIDQLYNDLKKEENDPYLCYNKYLYCDGLSVVNAAMYYKYGDCSNRGKTYLTYISYCDSLQSVYQQRLIDIINNGQLKEIGF